MRRKESYFTQKKLKMYLYLCHGDAVLSLNVAITGTLTLAVVSQPMRSFGHDDQTVELSRETSL